MNDDEMDMEELAVVPEDESKPLNEVIGEPKEIDVTVTMLHSRSVLPTDDSICTLTTQLLPEDCKNSATADLCQHTVAPLHQVASESGLLSASCFKLAWLHLAGVGGVKQSDQKALEYWRRVIVNTESNDAAFKTISMYMVGLCHYLGIGTELDLVTGWTLITESRKSCDEFVLAGQWVFGWPWGESIDHIQSSSCVSKVFFEHVILGSNQHRLLQHLEAMCYFYGFGTRKDQNTAVQMFLSLAKDSGFAVSQMILGSCYYDGYIVAQSHETAAEWFAKSSEQNYCWGQHALASCYAGGIGISEDDAKAVELYRKAADQGHANSQTSLGMHYGMGYGVPQDDAVAVEWYRKAVDQGNADAQNSLGSSYYAGDGVIQDYIKAVECFRMAADQGNSNARFNLGTCYYDGAGVPHDYTKAVEWYRKVADQEGGLAQKQLGECYAFGHGVLQDFAKAAEWYRMATDQGNTDAKAALEDISLQRKFSYERW